MPLSIEVHHALMDGLHVAKFVKQLQGYFNEPELNLV
jgi:chloramphenicol O-acetyltransferase type A